MTRLIEPAELVLVLAAIFRDAGILQCSEDVTGTVVLGEVGLEFTKGGLLGVEVVGDGLVSGAGVGYGFGFAARVGVVGEDAVFYEHDAKVDDLLVDPGTDGFWKVFFEFVD